MAFDLIAAYAQSEQPFFVSGSPAEMLKSAPQEITLRFTPGAKINSATLGSISIVRSGGATDPLGNGNDIAVVPGSMVVESAPNENQVIVRFAETLPDDVYRITVGPGLSAEAAVGSVNASEFDFQLDRGAFVQSVVPQPTASINRDGVYQLIHARGQIQVWFNIEDPLAQASAENPGFYRLQQIDPESNEPIGEVAFPTEVEYRADLGRSTIWFREPLKQEGMFRLDIGGADGIPPVEFQAGSDENSSFTTALQLGTLTAAGVVIEAAIESRPTVSTPAGVLGLPSQFGTIDEPGHRDLPVDSGDHGLPYLTVDPATGITVIQYNFGPEIGTDPQGNTLYNVITETQKQRAREILELYSLYSGVRFVETADQGMLVATGDLRAFSPAVPVDSVAGLGGPGFGALMSSAINWGDSEYGGSWFKVAMHEIGHALGLSHSYDLNSIMGAGLDGEPVFPGDYDIEHLRQLYPASGSDVDVYAFEIATAGGFSAQTIISRPGQPVTSYLDSVISLYREDVVNGQALRTLIARNDNFYGRDSFVGRELGPGKYFVAVTSTGNTAFDPEVSDSGANGRSEGDYRLSLAFTPLSATVNTIVDTTGTPIDGDRDGEAGGVFSFWFQTADKANTIYVDKGSTVPGPGDGTKDQAFKTISSALAAVQPTTKVIRILGKQATPYEIGVDPYGRPLEDGATFVVPAGVTVIVDRAAAFKFRNAIIDVGSSSELASRAGAAFQVLGTPGRRVVFTSWHDDTVGGDTDGLGMGSPDGGQWGGIVFRTDSDAASKAAFVNTISNADIRYGGGEVFVDSQPERFAPIQLENTRPTVVFNTIAKSAGAAIAATPNSFLDDGERVGPEFRGNRLLDNSVNGLFLKIDTEFGMPLERLEVSARFKSTDIVYVISENLMIAGGAGGYEEILNEATGTTEVIARATGRLAIDPGVVLKLQGARIELERGGSQLLVEGTPFQSVIFTSIGDNRYGAGGTFDTNGNVPDKFDAFGEPVDPLEFGDWGGVVLEAASRASLDHAYLAFGGGIVPIEGGFDAFNAVEVHQGSLRLANSRVEFNASGLATGDRSGRGGNDAAAVFIRGAQPILVGNDFRSNLGAVISIDANSLTDTYQPDTGRSTGPIDRYEAYDDNFGPLVRGNRIMTAMPNQGAARPVGNFNIDLAIDPSLPSFVVAAVEAAAARWEAVIVGDLSSQRDSTTGRRIDDVLVYVQPGLLGDIDTDGASGILANAGPTQFRSLFDADPFLPYVAEIGLDLADIDSDQLTITLFHEFAHAMGFTAVPELLSLIQGTDYVGLNALREYQVFAPGATGIPMQVEATGATGAHWDETVFGPELMTPVIDPGMNPLSRMTVGAFEDMGYTVDYAAADPYGLPGTGGPITINPIAGMVVRGGLLTIESVWDDTDIVSVLRDEILVGNFHTATGLRLVSAPDASLVVKLDGTDAGFTASGYELDTNDRIGGTVQVIGQPGYPVILTSLADDSVGASLDPIGMTVTDTNSDGALIGPMPGDWRSLQFLQFSNDRNVKVVLEAEQAYTGGDDQNGLAASAESLGVLAPNYPTGTNTWESAAEKSGDENRRLGFEVQGSIAFDNSGDVDVYSFVGYAGSEVWIDLDKTSSALDTMVELLDASGRVLARSIDSGVEGVVVPTEQVFDFVGGTTVAYQLVNTGVLPGSLVGTLYDFSGDIPIAVHTFSVDAAGVVEFRDVLNAPDTPAISGTFDAATGILTVIYAGSIGPTAVDVRYSYATNALTTAAGQAGVLGQYSWLGGDFYTTNPKDAGMRVILPGTQGNQVTYFIRVRSQPHYEPVDTGLANGGVAATSMPDYQASIADPAAVTAGVTSGHYQLRVRLRQQDEKPGSTVRYADIRYAMIGIDAEGLPANSLLTGDTGEAGDAGDSLGAAQYVGNLLQSDYALSIAGAIANEGDIDWYSFALNYEQIQSIAGANAGPYFAATMFDIDYADGFRGDLTISVFDDQGTLIYIGRDSNIADDQPGPGQTTAPGASGADFDDLSRGSAGKLDPFIGTVSLAAGGPTGGGGTESGDAVTAPDPTKQLRYYVAISSNERLPSAIDATFQAVATNPLIRLEPVTSVRRLVEDHIGTVGYQGVGGTEILPVTTLIDLQQLDLHVTPFTLGDVTLYVSSGGAVSMRDPVSGTLEAVVNNTDFNGIPLGDLDMRPDGRLFAYAGVNNDPDTAGRLIEIDPATGGITVVGDDQIPDIDADDPLNFQTTTDTVRALAFRATNFGEFDELWFVVADGPTSKLYRAETGGTTAGAPNPTASQTAEDSGTLGYRGRIALNRSYLTVTGLQFIDDGAGPLYGVTDKGLLISIAPGDKVPDDGAPENDGDPVIDFDAQATLVVDFSADLAAVGATGFTALAAAPQNLYNGSLRGKFFALTDNGRLALLDPEAATVDWVIQRGVVGQFGVSELADTSVLTPGMVVFGSGIAAGTTIESIVNAQSIILSAEAVPGPATNLAFLDQASVDNPTLIRAGLTTADGTGIALTDAADIRLDMFVISDDLPGWYGQILAKDTVTNSVTLTTLVDPSVVATFKFINISTVGYLPDWIGDHNFSEPVGNGSGIAFSPLDINLWHSTERRGGDAGHGVNSVPDGTRNSVAGETSMYFGLEQWESGRQYGVSDAAWQRYLTDGTGRGGTYDLPGGAYGSLTTNSFSLEGYSYTDKPVVYINYLLQTEGASGTPRNNLMRDSARVLISKDDGLSWELIATNNSVRNPNDSELASYASVSTRIDGEPGIQDPRQQVQELFDTAEWRQARIDLGEYAGETNLRFRFDFSTAGEMVPTEPGQAGEILGSAAISGDFNSLSRAANNAYEGFYIDDIIVGFAERGEMVTGGAADQNAFFDLNTPLPPNAPSQSLSGPYQLEIRRGTEYSGGLTLGAGIFQVFDTNDRLIPALGASNGYGPKLGDQNQPRQQGQFIVENNIISYSAEYGISIDAAARAAESNSPYPGVVRNLPTLNNARLVPGAVIRNNVFNEFGVAGILFSGDGNSGTVSAAAVPFGRIVNNTIYGGETAQGVGIQVSENAGPTLLNNLFANLVTGVSIDGSSRTQTVVGMSAYSGTATRVAGSTETGGIQIEDAPFVNPAARNFYLIAGSRAIDSALNSLQDRAEFTAVNSAIGVPPSPILAPDRDVYGQLRADDPGVTNLSGLGSNVFKDRGAVDRVDFVWPLVSLAVPLDGGPFDMNSGFDAVRVKAGGANTLTQFELQLVDAGSGIDPAAVLPEAFTLTRNDQLLTEGVDYLFRFLPATGRVVFEAASVYSLGTYVINAISRPASAPVGGLLTDRANNMLLPNKADGSTSFLIELGAVPAAPTALVGIVGDRQVMLEWVAPNSDGPIVSYRVRWQVAGSGQAVWTPWIDTGSTATSYTVGPNTYPLTNGAAYNFEVLAINGYGEGPSVFTGPLTPRVPAPAPVLLTAAASTGPFHTGVVNLSWAAPSMPAGETLLDYKVEYRPVGSSSWTQLSPDPVGLDPAAAIYGLINGRAYEYRVTTVTSLGDGLGATVTATTVGLPQVPTAVVVTTGDKAANVTWNPVTGEATGGSQITSYRVEWSANGTTWTGMDVGGSATTAVITGLVNNTTYVVRVAARNAQGQGFFAPAATTVTPQELSGPPTRLTGLASNGAVSLVWTAPQPSVSAGTVIDYVIQAATNYVGDVSAANWFTLPDGVSTLTRATVSVPNGLSHVFRVAAVTKNGVGAFSLPSPVLTPFDPNQLPGAPSVTTATSPQAGRAKLTWSAPPANGGSPVTGYVVRYRLAGTEAWRIISRTNQVVVFQGLVSGQDYQFQVRAVSATGLGALADMFTIRVL